MNSNHHLINLKEIGDERGGLVAINGNVDVPIAIRRVFYNYNAHQDSERGNHANINSSFVMISIKGSCTVIVDDGDCKVKYVLDKPSKALYIGKGLWKTMNNFTDDNVLLVLSDCHYNANEYIRDYSEFLKWKERTQELCNY